MGEEQKICYCFRFLKFILEEGRKRMRERGLPIYEEEHWLLPACAPRDQNKVGGSHIKRPNPHVFFL